MTIRVIAFIFIQINIICCFGQVSNNRIQNRILLKLDSGWYSSSTSNSDVEWDCVNKALTNKCLIYHNDQWFTIKPSGPGPYYLNISNQECKKLYGVQVVIIEGDPCKTDSYRLKKCIPFTDQSDFHLRLDSLDTNQEYLINIDGYLGDLCQFMIGFSSAPNGLSVDARKLNTVSVFVTQQDSIVSISWNFMTHSSFS